MSTIAIVTDSAADLPVKYREFKNLQIVPLSVTFEDKTYLDGEDMSTDMFYEKMAQSTTLPVTSQPTPEQFNRAYEKLLLNHDYVISIHISQGISGTMNSARLGKEMLAESLQERVHIIDSGTGSMVEGLMVIEALEMIEAGHSLQDILNRMTERVSRHMGLFMVDTLENLAKGGRISHLKSVVGTLLKLKPLLYMGYDSEGLIQEKSKVRGRKKAIREMIRITKEQALDIDNQRIAIVHGNADDIDQVVEMVQEELRPKEVIISIFGATLATHLGKNSLAFCILCK